MSTINKKAFSLVELMVSVTILVILSSIGFISYTSYLTNARDTQRKSDIAELSSALKLTKQQRGVYPNPGSSFSITYNGTNILAKQGKLDTSVIIPSLNKLPLDPKANIPYSYSITENGKEFELALTLENSGIPMALLSGDYKSVSAYILPTIILAINGNGSVDVNNSDSKKTFVFNEQDNLPYTFVSPYSPLANGATYNSITNDRLEYFVEDYLKPNNFYWQNSDYRSCGEIEEAGKKLAGIEQYQIVNNSGELETYSCTF